LVNVLVQLHILPKPQNPKTPKPQEVLYKGLIL